VFNQPQQAVGPASTRSFASRAYHCILLLLPWAMYACLLQGPRTFGRVSLSIKTSAGIVIVRCLQLQVGQAMVGWNPTLLAWLPSALGSCRCMGDTYLVRATTSTNLLTQPAAARQSETPESWALPAMHARFQHLMDCKSFLHAHCRASCASGH
jgi:hypothetical protein